MLRLQKVHSADVKLSEYINSLNGLSPQQKSQLAQSATSIEDISIMLKEMSKIEGSTTTQSGKNLSSADSNSVWGTKEITNSDSQDYAPTFSSSAVKKTASPTSQNQPAALKQNPFSGPTENNTNKNIEKVFNDDGVLQETIEKNMSPDGTLLSDLKKEYNTYGKVTGTTLSEYEDNGILVHKKTSETYDINGALMSKSAACYKYDLNKKIIEEIGENYNDTNNGVISYLTKNVLDAKGNTTQSTTDKYDKNGAKVSSEVYKTEVIKEGNINRTSRTIYDKNGIPFSSVIDDKVLDEKGRQLKGELKMYEDGILEKRSITESSNSNPQPREITEQYDKNGLVTERIIDERDAVTTSTTEHFSEGKLTGKTVTKNPYSQSGKNTIDKEIIEQYDAGGKFLSKSITSHVYDTEKKESGVDDADSKVVIENYNESNKLTRKAISTILRNAKNLRMSENTKVYDGSGNLTQNIVDKYKIVDGRSFPDSRVKTKYKAGAVVSTETITPSQVKGEYNYKITDAQGRVSNIIEVKKSNNGLSVVKKFVSPDGTKTNYQYSEDDKGNKKLNYQIVDNNNKELMSLSREYQKINDHLSISKVNSKEYKIETNNDTINILDVANNEITQLDLSKLVIDDNIKLKNMLKGLPGDVLINVSKETNKIGTDFDNGGYAQTNEEYITSEEAPSVFVHELGHAIDSTPNRVNESSYIVRENTEFKKIFSEEQELFKNSSTESEQQAFAYLADLKEFTAETKAITTLINDKESNAMRQVMIMKNFPKSVAFASKLLDEIEASKKQRKSL